MRMETAKIRYKNGQLHAAEITRFSNISNSAKTRWQIDIIPKNEAIHTDLLTTQNASIQVFNSIDDALKAVKEIGFDKATIYL